MYKILVIVLRKSLVLELYILFPTILLFSKFNEGNIHFSNMNLPIKELSIYLGVEGNLKFINIEIILHMHLIIYGIAVILSINDCSNCKST